MTNVYVTCWDYVITIKVGTSKKKNEKANPKPDTNDQSLWQSGAKRCKNEVQQTTSTQHTSQDTHTRQSTNSE